MTSNEQNTGMPREDALEQLLGHAPPRPVPTAAAEAQARDAVRNEWQSVVRRRTRRSSIARFAIAATVLIAAFVSFNQFRTSGIAPVEVATIAKSTGSIYLLGKQSELRESGDLKVVHAGQTIVTGVDSRIAFALESGPALRVDEDSRIEFTDRGAIFLYSGSVYVDSKPLLAGIAQGSVTITTKYGVVTHLGTQYMTTVEGSSLSVSVRDGRVSIDGTYHDATVVPGQQVTLRDSQRPKTANVAVYGDYWSWVDEMAPSADFDGKSVLEFLQWVSHETGLELQFETQSARKRAQDKDFGGTVDSPPAKALHVYMMTIDLDWRISDGVIYISEKGTR